MNLRIEWDSQKAARNEAKHGVTFSEAATVLGDPLSITLDDPAHSRSEERLLLLGRSSAGRFLVVVIAERGEAIRIISARDMTPRERKTYEQAPRS
jgi:uncharacterized DUF497 family protein